MLCQGAAIPITAEFSEVGDQLQLELIPYPFSVFIRTNCLWLQASHRLCNSEAPDVCHVRPDDSHHPADQILSAPVMTGNA